MQIKEYELAVSIAEKLLKLQVDHEVAYLAAFAERKLNHLDKALTYAIQVRSGDSSPNVMNLNLLAEIYHAMGQRDKAVSTLDEILTIDPLNTKARRLREEIHD